MEHLTVNYALFSFGALIAILNPVGVLPQYITLTSELDHEELKSTTKKAVITAGITLIIVSLIGSFVLQFFQITLSAFKIAGGLILFKIAIDMIYARLVQSMMSQHERKEGAAKEDVSIFPLAIPLIAGPGSITTVVMLENKASSLTEHLFLIAALTTCIAMLYIVLTLAKKISYYLGHIGINIMTRIMGLILAAIATQFIINGIDEITLVKLF